MTRCGLRSLHLHTADSTLAGRHEQAGGAGGHGVSSLRPLPRVPPPPFAAPNNQRGRKQERGARLGGAVHADGEVLGHVPLLHGADDRRLQVAAELGQGCGQGGQAGRQARQGGAGRYSRHAVGLARGRAGRHAGRQAGRQATASPRVSGSQLGSSAPSLSSSFARCARPRVHAKMEAMGLVLVGLPFWYSRQCRVTVPAAEVEVQEATAGQRVGVRTEATAAAHWQRCCRKSLPSAGQACPATHRGRPLPPPSCHQG